VIDEKGLTIIPLGMYLKHGLVKVRLGVAKGKKAYDKRAALKDRQDKREMDRSMKDNE
jgi:SsrA-binding protein